MPYKNLQRKKQHQGQYYRKHRNKLIAYAAKYRAASDAAIKKNRQLYYAANRDSILAKNRAWEIRNASKVAKKRCILYLQNRRENLIRAKKRRERYGFAERHAQYMRKYYRNNRKKLIAQVKQWTLKNHEWKIAYECTRAAIKKGATIGDRQEIKAFYKMVYTSQRIDCYWCKKPVPKGKRHIDHKIPLCRGGLHCISNFVPACAKCNLEKHSAMPDEFIRRRLAS